MLSTLFISSKAQIVSAGAETKKVNDKRVIFIAANTIGLKDIADAKTPAIDKILKTGAIGLMNTRAADFQYPGNAYLSIGSGARAQAGRFGGVGFNALEKMPAELYAGLLMPKELTLQNTEINLPDTAVINIGATYAARTNFKYRKNIVPGLLGETMSKANIKTAVVGNSDTLDGIHREITLVSMDANGKTDFGNVANDLNLIDKSFPGGMRTNYGKLSAAVIDMLDKASFVAVDLGDAARIDAQRSLMKQSVYEKRKKEAVESLDNFVSMLTSEIDKKNTMFVIAAPQASRQALVEQNYLTPLIVSGLGSGVLVSNTTKRKGLVANVDVAPSIVRYLGLRVPIEMSGNAIKTRPKRNPVKFLQNRHNHISMMRKARKPFLLSYSLLIMVALVATLVLIRLSHLGYFIREKSRSFVKVTLLSLMSVPPASLIYLRPDISNPWVGYSSFIIIVLGLSFFAYYLARFHRLGPVFFLAALTAALVIGDTMTGTYLSERSFFGSDLMMGGRFYGIGNTLMGIVIGASVLSLVCLFSLSKRFGGRTMIMWISTTALLFMAIVIGHPDLGANVGGLVSGVATALIFRHILSGQKLNMKVVAVNLIVMMLVVTAVLRVDLSPSHETKSHAGKAMKLIEAQGGSAVSDIIVRKLSMNLRGALSYPGYFALIMALLGYALSWAMMDKFTAFGQLWNEFELVAKGLITMVCSASLVLVVNDTGAVAAASLLAYLIVPLFYLTLNNLNNKTRVGLGPCV